MPVDQIVYYYCKFYLKKSFTKNFGMFFSSEIQLQFYLFLDSVNSGKWKTSNFFDIFYRK